MICTLDRRGLLRDRLHGNWGDDKECAVRGGPEQLFDGADASDGKEIFDIHVHDIFRC